jgi:hypothetical protein
VSKYFGCLESGIFSKNNMIFQLQENKANSVFANGMRQDSAWRCAAHRNSKGISFLNSLGGIIAARGLRCKSTPSGNIKKGLGDILNTIPSIRTSHTNFPLPFPGGEAVFMEAEA